jgi:hypothetical protein
MEGKDAKEAVESVGQVKTNRTVVVLLGAVAATLLLLCFLKVRAEMAWREVVRDPSPEQYVAFHHSHPLSRHLRAVKADVNTRYELSVSMTGLFEGVANQKIDIEVVGHPELSGDYDLAAAESLGLGTKVNESGVIEPEDQSLKNVELLVASTDAKPRIVAVVK